MSYTPRQKIADQLFFRVLSIYLMILMAVILLLSVIALDNEREKVEGELLLLGEKISAELSAPLWFFDEEKIQSQIEPLEENSVISALELYDQQQENRLVATEIRSGWWQFSTTFKVIYEHDAGVEPVGVLVLYSNAAVLFERIRVQLIVMASGMVLMLITLWLTLRVVGNRLLSRPLQQLGDFYHKMEFAVVDGLERPEWADNDNELTLLAQESDQMIHRLGRSKQELLLAKDEAERSRLSFQNLLGNLQGMVYRCFNDREWTMEFISDGSYELTGYHSDEIVGNRVISYNEIIHQDERERIWDEVQTALENRERFQITYRIKKRGGEERVVLENGVGVYSGDGELIAIEGFVTDITAQRLNEKKLEEYSGTLEKRIDERTQELIKANQSKDEFLASMSHELRTPLTSIIGNTGLLLDAGKCGGKACPQPDAERILQAIQNAGSNQLALVNDILDMSKIESGKFTIDQVPYDLSIMLDELAQMFSVRAEDAGVRFVVDQKHREQQMLMGDAQRISQILINLIGNAIKFTEQGEVQLTVWMDAEKLFFRVKDTGIGMAAVMVDKLFQRFHQADGSISRRFGGSGLGLYISQNLADLMGGYIEVSSEEGIGSSFQLVLPYQPTDTRVIQSQTEGKVSILDEKLSGKVLIAEDTPELQLLEKRILESLGLTVTIAADGKQAVEQVNRHHFDVVLMDMQMPVMDGIEATRILREQGYTLPVIALTANVMQKHREAFYGAGCDGFIGKPIDKGELRKLLKKYLRNQEPEREFGVAEEVDDELMAIFNESAANYIEALKSAMESKDWDALRKTAHTVKGSAASFGFGGISKRAEGVQFAIDEENFEQISDRVMDLLADLQSIVQ